MIKVKDPMLIKNVLEPTKFADLKAKTIEFYEESTMDAFEKGFGRYQLNKSPWLDELHNDLTAVAREHFESETLIPSWYQLAVYEGPKAQLHHHKDDNACTYNIDLCIYQKTPWSIWVEGKEYFLDENEALLMYGNDQEHWREPFPDPMNNVVANVFLFYCEPDHWYFTKGPEYLYVLREQNNTRGMM